MPLSCCAPLACSYIFMKHSFNCWGEYPIITFHLLRNGINIDEVFPQTLLFVRHFLYCLLYIEPTSVPRWPLCNIHQSPFTRHLARSVSTKNAPCQQAQRFSFTSVRFLCWARVVRIAKFFRLSDTLICVKIKLVMILTFVQ